MAKCAECGAEMNEAQKELGCSLHVPCNDPITDDQVNELATRITKRIKVG